MADPGRFQHIILYAVDGMGLGAQPDARSYGGRGADSVGHAASYVGGLDVPFLQWLGLGNIASIAGVEPAETPRATRARLARRGEGVDAAGALAELTMGCMGELVSQGRQVISLGMAADLVSDEQASLRIQTEVPDDVLFYMADVLENEEYKHTPSLVVGMFGPARADTAFGPVATARLMDRVDAHVSALLDVLTADHLLLLVSAGGADGSLGATAQRTREFSPLLAYTSGIAEGVDLGAGRCLADVAATIAENFALEPRAEGDSFYEALCA